jgi:hypothetical protein
VRSVSAMDMTVLTVLSRMLSKRAARRRILFPYLSHCKETCEYANSGTMDDGLRVVMLDAMRGVMNIAYTIMFCVFFPSKLVSLPHISFAFCHNWTCDDTNVSLDSLILTFLLYNFSCLM